MKVKVVCTPSAVLPTYQTKSAVGLDLRADTDSIITLRPLQRAMVPTGLRVEIPEGYELQIRPRSGLAAKHGITVLNSPGTIDPDYRGEIKVILVNLSEEPYSIEPGERIAQAIFAKYEQLEWEEVEVLSETERGEGGFGSTGTKK